MNDPFVGTWKLNREKSAFDANHRPADATMRWEQEQNGVYVMHAEGTNAKGERCAERPQKLIPDGNGYPVPDLPGLTAVTTKPSPNTIRAEVKREDGSIAGGGTYVVDDDGASMIATTEGWDTQLRRFQMRTVWDRQR